MEIIEKVLTDAYVLKPKLFEDDRGYFYESYNENLYSKTFGAQIKFIQDNQSLSSKGTLRGMHFQKDEASQSKLVRVIRGSVFDVAIDLRIGSPTFKKWYGLELSESNQLQFFIPRGFAHGFIALEDETIFQYKVDNYYSKEHEMGIIWNDSEINIEWPNIEKHLSQKDRKLPPLNETHYFFS